MTTTTGKLTDLLDHQAKELWVSNDGEHMLGLVCDTGVFIMDTYADCCSESWWADAVGVKQLLGGRVTAVEEIELPAPEDDRTRQEYDQAYGIRIATDRGACDLIYRNSSNGYYGGYSFFRWEQALPAVRGWDAPRDAEPPANGWRQINGDWSA